MTQTFSIIVFGRYVYLLDTNSGFDSTNQIVDSVLAPLLELADWSVFKWSVNCNSIIDRYDFSLSHCLAETDSSDSGQQLTVTHSYKVFRSSNYALDNDLTYLSPAAMRTRLFNRFNSESYGKFDEKAIYSDSDAAVDGAATAAVVDDNAVSLMERKRQHYHQQQVQDLRNLWQVYVQTTLWSHNESVGYKAVITRQQQPTDAAALDMILQLFQHLPWLTDDKPYATGQLTNRSTNQHGIITVDCGDSMNRQSVVTNKIEVQYDNAGRMSISDTTEPATFYDHTNIPHRYSYQAGRHCLLTSRQ